MKILYDHQIFDAQRFGGISRYFSELLNRFETDKNVEWELPIHYSDNEYLKNMSFFRDKLVSFKQKPDPFKEFMFGMQFRGKGILYKMRNKVFKSHLSARIEDNKTKSITKLVEGNFDIFHPTYYDDYFLDYIGEKPFVLTVYDLIHQVFPEFLLHDSPDKSALMLHKAKKILAISENTKKDLINIFNVDEQKIVVTHLGNSLEVSGMVSDEFKNKLPAQFLLFVGNREGYKNFLFFIQVIAAIINKEKDLHIVCTGPPLSEKELFLLSKTGITDRIIHTYVSDSELAFLYRNAAAFIFPSMYEGFGLPILEAFSCGCPVLVSSTSSMTEIGEEAVIYFEPKNAASMIGAIKTALHNNDVKREKINMGYQQLKKFSWSNTAELTKDVYAEIVSV